FFAADPLSAHDGRAPRLMLDEDVRQIRQKVRAAEHRDDLEFDLRLAARTDDLLQALNETRPQVVHFSGHGQSEGLVLVSADGRRPHVVPAPALEQLFQVFRGDIRVVVLNACFSLPQAEAIAASVGCAIGTSGPISDEGAITFAGAFYRAIAFGQSVQAAYDQARTALALEHVDDRECPRLVVRPGVDAARLVLVAPGGEGVERRGKGRVRMAIAGLALVATVVAAVLTLGDRATPSAGAQSADSVQAAAPTVQDTSPSPISAPAPAARERAVRRPQENDGQPVAVTQPAGAGEQPVQTPDDAASTTFHKLPDEPDTFALRRDRPRDPTLQPAFPR
ncbi:MAG TPA: CHAT domain-containing protein, partial [Longimicrobium sp.]|nr:CHAT domain-containing protein [Longimicrobium sp.]